MKDRRISKMALSMRERAQVFVEAAWLLCFELECDAVALKNCSDALAKRCVLGLARF